MSSADYNSSPSLPTAKITNPDVTRIINSDEIQSVVRPAKDVALNARGRTKRKNPLINKSALYRLNPYAKTLKVNELGALFVYLIYFNSLAIFLRTRD